MSNATDLDTSQSPQTRDSVTSVRDREIQVPQSECKIEETKEISLNSKHEEVPKTSTLRFILIMISTSFSVFLVTVDRGIIATAMYIKPLPFFSFSLNLSPIDLG